MDTNSVDVVRISSLGPMSTLPTGTRLTLSSSCTSSACSGFEGAIDYDEFKSNVESDVSGITLFTYLSKAPSFVLIFSNLALLLLW